MKTILYLGIIFLIAGLSSAHGATTDRMNIASHPTSQMNRSDDENISKWDDEFSVVQIRSSADNSLQPAYFFSSQSKKLKPLVVSLHTWSGDFSQEDPLAVKVKNANWNYIHPDFRGPNRNKDACLSKKAISDIDDAIQYATNNGPVDTQNIFIVGGSGGGYATLGSYLKTSYKIKAFLAWSPISDLSTWYYQSKNRNTKYAKDIQQCTSNGISLDENEARRRSPFYWDMPINPKGKLEIFAGVNDGYTGSVPISHSILFFNKVVDHYGYSEIRIEETDIVKLLTRGVETNNDFGQIEGRAVLYKKTSIPASLTIFDGTHEMLPEYCFQRLQDIVQHGTTLDGSPVIHSPRL